ncbi:luciferin sulfotransferase [Athalia rosae]|uniref:luciferin sulfotransferase n=1 Tax=Athalia rosae TaxID=37344 RepID=UPI002033CAD3|nr:luciferin sulfotransferase [Athalia rosae]
MAHQICPADQDTVDLIKKHYPSDVEFKYVRINGVLLSEYYLKSIDLVENFRIRDDDVWVCSFPKTGTTWSQEMVWCVNNDLDFERAKVPLTERFPFFECSAVFGGLLYPDGKPDSDIPEYFADCISFVEKLPSPRFIKTHLPFHLLPRQLRSGETKAKIVYVFRNVKDTCISYYHHTRLFDGYEKNFDSFAELFLQNALHYAPFWDHVLSYWNLRKRDNMLILKYEDMKRDLPSIIKNTATFFGKNLTSDQLTTLTQHLSFSSMRENPAVNNDQLSAHVQKILQTKREGKFMRSGAMDQWKTVMTSELTKKFDDMTARKLEGTGLSY